MNYFGIIVLMIKFTTQLECVYWILYFSTKNFFSDKEYLSLMNLKWNLRQYLLLTFGWHNPTWIHDVLLKRRSFDRFVWNSQYFQGGFKKASWRKVLYFRQKTTFFSSYTVTSYSSAGTTRSTWKCFEFVRHERIDWKMQNISRTSGK